MYVQTLNELGGQFTVLVGILAYYAKGRGFDLRTAQIFDTLHFKHYQISFKLIN
jgi:hypothetical protein